MRWIPLIFVLATGCGPKPIGRPYNEAVAAQLALGTATAAEVKTAMGAPYQARALVKSDAPEDCPSARESWSYSYDDFKESTCASSLYFDESARLCGRTTKATKRGPACSGVAP